MPILNQIIELETESGISIHNITPEIKATIARTSIKNGHVIVFSRHTTTAVAINEYEVRLLEDLKQHFDKLVPTTAKYLHNDLHLRDVPPNEPINAHSHLIAMMLNNSETIPLIDGELALGKWQSILFFELDGSRHREILIQISGE